MGTNALGRAEQQEGGTREERSGERDLLSDDMLIVALFLAFLLFSGVGPLVTYLIDQYEVVGWKISPRPVPMSSSVASVVAGACSQLFSTASVTLDDVVLRLVSRVVAGQQSCHRKLPSASK